MHRTRLADRRLPVYSKGEEIFNMSSHTLGAVLALAGMILCIIRAALGYNIAGIIASCLYGVSMICLYTMSSIYHGLGKGTAKKVFQIIDHCTIYFMIAGSYMPVVFCVIMPQSLTVGWVIFGIEWGLACLACALTAIDLESTKVLSMLCYLGMGWTIIIFYKYLKVIAPMGIFLFLLGGVLYTVGAVIYGMKRKFAHNIFHVFVVLGSIAHFFAIIFYVL